MNALGFMGFGEAAPAIAEGLAEAGLRNLYSYDIAYEASPNLFAPRMARSGTKMTKDPAELASRCNLIFSLVTCTEAVPAAASIAAHLTSDHVYVDMNSASPKAKREVAAIVEKGGAQFIEAAVMSVVPPLRHRVPVLLCGKAANGLVSQLESFGMNLEVLGDNIGAASATKMFRSIMVKGMQALFIECLLAARHFDAERRVLDTVTASYPGINWNEFADYLIGRSTLHAGRQSHEMEEVSRTLESIGELPLMARATAERLRRFSELGFKDVFGDAGPDTYAEVLELLSAREQNKS